MSACVLVSSCAAMTRSRCATSGRTYTPTCFRPWREAGPARPGAARRRGRLQRIGKPAHGVPALSRRPPSRSAPIPARPGRCEAPERTLRVDLSAPGRLPRHGRQAPARHRRHRFPWLRSRFRTATTRAAVTACMRSSVATAASRSTKDGRTGTTMRSAALAATLAAVSAPAHRGGVSRGTPRLHRRRRPAPARHQAGLALLPVPPAPRIRAAHPTRRPSPAGQGPAPRRCDPAVRPQRRGVGRAWSSRRPPEAGSRRAKLFLRPRRSTQPVSTSVGYQVDLEEARRLLQRGQHGAQHHHYAGSRSGSKPRRAGRSLRNGYSGTQPVQLLLLCPFSSPQECATSCAMSPRRTPPARPAGPPSRCGSGTRRADRPHHRASAPTEA